jgi:hypothetical protein
MHEDITCEVCRPRREPEMACQHAVDKSAEALFTRLNKPVDLGQFKPAPCYRSLSTKPVRINEATFEA